MYRCEFTSTVDCSELTTVQLQVQKATIQLGHMEKAGNGNGTEMETEMEN